MNIKYNSVSAALLLVIISLLTITVIGMETGTGLTRVEASDGLPQEASFSAIEAIDIDGDGKDEMILGGAGFVEGEIRTEGILIFSYDISSSKWEPFGSGLPGAGSGIYYGALGIGDVNDDGNLDIVSPVPSRWYDVETSENGLDIFIGDGSGGFSFLHHVQMMDSNLGSSNEVEVYDLDDDGFNDLIASTYSGVKVFFGDGSGTRWIERSPPAVRTVEISGIGIGDLDNDGLLDIVGTPGQGSYEVEIYIQGALRTWTDVPFVETDAGYGAKVVDVNQDGNQDVIFGTRTEGIKVHLGQGTTTLTSFPTTDGSDGLPDDNGDWDQIELADVNGDGKPDMIAAINSESYIHCFINDLPDGWTEVFADSESLFVGGDAYGANFGDWNGDGQLDIGGCSWDHGVDAWIIPSSESTKPIANAGRDRTVNIGETVVLDGSGSNDPDGTIVEWEWTCTSHNDLVLNDAYTSAPSFSADEVGEYNINLRVRDDDDEWSLASRVIITVIDPSVNLKPVAVAGSPQFVFVGDDVEFDGSGSYDDDGDIASWSWTCTSHTGLPLEDADTAFPTFVPTDEDTYVFRLTVTDDDDERSDPDSVSVDASHRIFKSRIGPFKYDDGKVLSGATVTMKLGSEKKKAVTDEDGYATFEMGLKEGSYSCYLEKDDNVLIEEFGVKISPTGIISFDDGSLPKAAVSDTGSGSSSFYMIVIGVIAAIAILALVIFLIARSRDGSKRVEYAQEVGDYACETCGSTLIYMEDFNMYYCRSCEKYAGQ